jgi:hypothetical protein
MSREAETLTAKMGQVVVRMQSGAKLYSSRQGQYWLNNAMESGVHASTFWALAGRGFVTCVKRGHTQAEFGLTEKGWNWR